MAMERKNKILSLIMTAIMLVSVAGGVFFGADNDEDIYKNLKGFFVCADDEDVFYNEATRTKINYEVQESAEQIPETIEQVTQEEFESINNGYASKFFLDRLDERDQNVYRQLYKGIYDFQESISIDSNVLKQDNIGDFIVLLTSSNPYLNYISTNYTISLNKKGYVTAVNVEYSTTKQEADAQRRELDRKIDEILTGITPFMSDYQKVKYIHDYIIKNCEYDDKSPQPYSAYGCLVQGRCVCEGYTKAMFALCDKAGIKALPVVGQAGETGEGQGHIWNKIMIDQNWYNFDVTWDDPKGDMGKDYVRYDYFGVDDSRFEHNHTPDKNIYMKYPLADKNDADYFEINHLVYDGSEPAAVTMWSAALLAIGDGSGLARIRCADEDSYKAAIKELFDPLDPSGTTKTFNILNSILEDYHMKPVVGYSIINNDEVYTITVKFDVAADVY